MNSLKELVGKNVFCLFVIYILVFTVSSTVEAKKKEVRKSQDVNFAEVDIEGKTHNPDGAFLVQKRGIDFVPLYKMKTQFDQRIKESVNYLR